jgi:hypothetical protein
MIKTLTLLTLLAIFAFSPVANATKFYYDNHQGGWTLYRDIPDGYPDDVFYASSLPGIVMVYTNWVAQRNLH